MPAYLTFADYDHSPEPHQIKAIYDSGFPGIRPEFFAARPPASVPTFYGAFPELVDFGKGKVSLPYKFALAMEPEYGRYEAQTTGDCVSHGIRNAGMIDYCADAYMGETKYLGRLATENIYGMRGHGGQGADPNRLSIYVGPDGSGGYLLRRAYEVAGTNNRVDLSKYNSSIGHNWGPTGTPQWLNQIAATNKALRVFQCQTTAEARDAIAAGFGIGAASNYGFSSQRNADGLSEQQGSWSHEMSFTGFDDSDWCHQKYGGGSPLVIQSWGLWNSGPKRHEQPDGSFWIRPAVAESYARQGGLFAFCAVRGFERQLIYDRAREIEKAMKGW